MKCETLHLCNLSHVTEIKFHLQFVNKNDAIVFFSRKLNDKQYMLIKEAEKKFRVYTIIHENTQNLKSHSYDEWVDLVNQYQKTYTWK
ncbi:MAG: hypothetical protein AB8B80_16375 [Marinicellaceae bacterium]